MRTDAAPQQVTTPAASETREEREKRLVARYGNRVDYLFDSFRLWRAVANSRLSFNDSLKAATQSLNPRAKKKPARKLLSIDIELLINARASELARARGSNSGEPNQTDINAAAREMALSDQRGSK